MRTGNPDARRGFGASLFLLPAALCLLLAACSLHRAPVSGPAPETAPSAPPAAEELLPSPTPQAEAVPTPEASEPPRAAEPADSELVCVTDYIPSLTVELRYASSDNFTGRTIYDFSDAWLRYGTVRKLLIVQNALAESGYGLKLWDAYRPSEAQFRLWETVPDPVWVANPYTGHSSHANGGTVDLTLVRTDGSAPEMPSAFDDFSPRADRDYSDVSDEAGENALLLERAMTAAGFVPYAGEWWHYSDRDDYPFEDLEALRFPLDRQAVFEPKGEGELPLRAAPDGDAEVLTLIPRGTAFFVMGWAGDYARIVFRGLQGYASAEDIRLQSP